MVRYYVVKGRVQGVGFRWLVHREAGLRGLKGWVRNTERGEVEVIVAGSPEQLADAITEWFLAGAVDGFNLMPDVEPSGAEAFVEHVVPILRRRGLFRTEYEGTTLRDHLGLPRPQKLRTAA